MWIKVALSVPFEGGILSYRLAEKFQSVIELGLRVLVPLGNRKMIGIVVATEGVKPLDQEGRFVFEILDEKPIINATQIHMSYFISRYYACDFFAALQLCLPPDFLKQEQNYYTLTSKGLRAQVFGLAMGLNAKDVACLLSFEAKQKRSAKDLVKDGFTKRRIEHLCTNQCLEIQHQNQPPKARSFIEVLWVDGGNDISGRAFALHALDHWLRQRTVAISMSELSFLFSGVAGKIKRLEALNRVKVIKSTVKVQNARLVEDNSTRKLLSAEQQIAVDRILRKDDVAKNNEQHAFLLEGVTGSGKTEVYLRVLEEVLQSGKNALFIVPEIGLTPLLYTRLRDFTGEEIAVLHSGLSLRERRDTFQLILKGQFRVVLGARSALFAPLDNIGLIVIDEEHDASLKQDINPPYHARDVALWLANHLKAICILGSATPSLESVYNASKGKIEILRLLSRVTKNTLPEIELIDLKGRKEDTKNRHLDSAKDLLPGVILSEPLKKHLQSNYIAGNQSLLFVNQRGYSSVLFCPDCGHMNNCPDCSISLTLHQKKSVLLCHQCDYQEKIVMQCRVCSGQLLALGVGTERVEAELKLLFPEARLLRIDRDTVSKKQQLTTALREISERKVDFIVGTQMLAKGHDFPGITLVGLVLADIALSMPDFRASERAFSLITQVAGRAGRGDKEGRVYLQSYMSEHPAIQSALQYKVHNFQKEELATREDLFFPPFSRALLIRLDNENENVVQMMADRLGKKLRKDEQYLRKKNVLTEKVQILGPSTAPLEKVRKRYRYQILVLCASHRSRAKLLYTIQQDQVLKDALKKGKTRLFLDVDPINML